MELTSDIMGKGVSRAARRRRDARKGSLADSSSTTTGEMNGAKKLNSGQLQTEGIRNECRNLQMTRVHALPTSVVPISLPFVTAEVIESWLTPVRGVRRKLVKNMM